MIQYSSQYEKIHICLQSAYPKAEGILYDPHGSRHNQNGKQDSWGQEKWGDLDSSLEVTPLERKSLGPSVFFQCYFIWLFSPVDT